LRDVSEESQFFDSKDSNPNIKINLKLKNKEVRHLNEVVKFEERRMTRTVSKTPHGAHDKKISNFRTMKSVANDAFNASTP